MSSLTSVNLNALYSATGSSASGIDVAAAVNQILYADRATERQWQGQQQLIDLQSSVLNQLNLGGSVLMDNLDALQDPLGALAARTAVSSLPSLVTASAAAGTSAGSHVVVVQHLAATAAWYSDAVNDASTSFAAGSYDLTVGSGSSQQTVTVDLGNGVNTPNQLASYINGLKLGVSASVITDATGARVALVANGSGAAGDFRLSPTSSGPSTNLFTQAVEGVNAALTVDGVPVSSATNTVSGVINGVTLNLGGETNGAEAVISVGPDTGRASQAVQAFVSTYNQLVSLVNSQFTYDTVNKTSGPLGGDSTVRRFQQELLAAPSFSMQGNSVGTLRSLGITMNDDGSLTVDSAGLSAAIQADPAAAQSFFQGASSNGFAAKIKQSVDAFAGPADGAFTVDLRSAGNQRSNLQDQIDDFERYLTAEQARLTNVYNQANILLLQLPAQQKYLDSMFGNGNNGSNG